MSEEKLKNIEERIKKLQQQKKEILKKEKEKARKERTHRLIERGAMLESIFELDDHVSNEQVKLLLELFASLHVNSEDRYLDMAKQKVEIYK